MPAYQTSNFAYQGANQFAYQTVQTSAATPTPAAATLGGTKATKKVRGPYWDPKIYEAYIQRCIAERYTPRADVAVAVLKEELVDAVELRRSADQLQIDALLKEQQILVRLIALEKAKRDVMALRARQKMLEQQIEQMEEDEMTALLAAFDDMED